METTQLTQPEILISTQDRRKVEEVVLRAHQALQDEIKEKNRVIDELHAERELRDRFLTALATELRSRIVAAKASVELLPCLPEDSKLRERLPRKMAEQLLEMDLRIRDFADASRIHSGKKLALALEECDLQELVVGIRSEFPNTSPERLVIRADRAITGVFSPDNVRRALKELIQNALQHGATGAPVHVTLKQAEDEAVIVVQNQGPPLSAEAQKAIFTPFGKFSLTETRVGKGAGLGLLIVSGMAESHGGSITVESSAEKGTSFSLRLPLE